MERLDMLPFFTKPFHDACWTDGRSLPVQVRSFFLYNKSSVEWCHRHYIDNEIYCDVSLRYHDCRNKILAIRVNMT